jgi:hypothetical protein
MTVDPLSYVFISELRSASLVSASDSSKMSTIFGGYVVCFFNAEVRYSLYIEQSTYQMLFDE